MKIFSFASTALPLGALVVLSCIAPAQAAPVQPLPLSTSANIETVQHASCRLLAWVSGVAHRVSLGCAVTLTATGTRSPPSASIPARPERIGTRPATAAPMHRQTYCQSMFGGTNGDGSTPCDNGY